MYADEGYDASKEVGFIETSADSHEKIHTKIIPNTSIVAEVQSLSHKGEGEVYLDTKRGVQKYVVSATFPQEKIRVDPYKSKRKRKSRQAKLKGVLYSPWRKTAPFCEHYRVCGGCSMQELSYLQQLKIKTQHVHDLLVETLERENATLSEGDKIVIADLAKPSIASIKRYFYRNRVDYTCGYRWKESLDIKESQDKESGYRDWQSLGLGFHVKGFYDKIVHLSTCFLHGSNAIRKSIYSWCVENNVDFFNLRILEGFMRSVTIRNNIAGEYMVIISATAFSTMPKDGSDVSSSPALSNGSQYTTLQDLCDCLVKNHKDIVSIYSVINTTHNDVLTDLDHTLIYGKEFLLEQCGHVQLMIYPKVFYQTNSYMTPILYQAIVDLADIDLHERVLDLYCGIGSIGLFIASKVSSVVGIEVIEESVSVAERNAKLNNIDNIKFYMGTSEKLLDNPIEALMPNNFDTIIVDPPRAGLHPKVISYLRKSGIDKIVYVSCNPTSLAKDLGMLCDVYSLQKWQSVDMFPHTHHIETVCVLRAK